MTRDAADLLFEGAVDDEEEEDGAEEADDDDDDDILNAQVSLSAIHCLRSSQLGAHFHAKAPFGRSLQSHPRKKPTGNF